MEYLLDANGERVLDNNGDYIKVQSQAEKTRQQAQDTFKKEWEDYQKSVKQPEIVEALFPRSVQNVESGEGLGKGILKSGLDVASLPGRALFSGLAGAFEKYGTDTDKPLLNIIGDYASDITNPGGVEGFVKDLFVNPLNLIPGVGEIKGIGAGVRGAGNLATKGLRNIPLEASQNVASRLPTITKNIVQSPSTRLISEPIGEGALNVGLGRIEEPSGESDISNFALGVIGSAPGLASKNIKDFNRSVMTDEIMDQVLQRTGKVGGTVERNLPQIVYNENKKTHDWLKSIGKLPSNSKFPKDLESGIREGEKLSNIVNALKNPTQKTSRLPEEFDFIDIPKDPEIEYPGISERSILNYFPKERPTPGPNIELPLVSEFIGTSMGIPGAATFKTNQGKGKQIVQKTIPRAIEKNVANTSSLASGIGNLLWKNMYRPGSDNTK